jgi:outer membrane immunogenic protein
MKKLIIASFGCAIFCATPAFAADMPSRAPVYKAAAAPVYNWSGCYGGIQGGYAWGEGTGAASGFSPDGGFVGGTLGCNVQSNNFVWGVESDLAWASLDDTVAGVSTKVDWIGSARLRAGIVTTPNTLLYATGGFGAGHNKITAGGLDDSNTQYGWTAGAGIEWVAGNNWTAKVEYIHYDFDEKSYANVVGKVGATFDTVKVGLNYRFNSGY